MLHLYQISHNSSDCFSFPVESALNAVSHSEVCFKNPFDLTSKHQKKKWTQESWEDIHISLTMKKTSFYYIFSQVSAENKLQLSLRAGLWRWNPLSWGQGGLFWLDCHAPEQQAIQQVYGVLCVKANRSSLACGVDGLNWYLLYLSLKSYSFFIQWEITH